MGLYIQSSAVMIRLQGKVAFSPNPNNDNEMSFAFLNVLIQEAEQNVEMDLSPRYFAPFQTDVGGSFNQLPLRPTLGYLRTMCELKACMRVLQTDFGRGSAVSGESYYGSLEKQYDEMSKKLLEKDELDAYKYPPLPGLKLNYQNIADDGYKGMVLNSSIYGDLGSYPATTINDPGSNFWAITPADLIGPEPCPTNPYGPGGPTS